MKVLVATDAHIYRTPDGCYWCAAIYGYQFWQRYLEVFETVRVAARVKPVEGRQEKWKRVDGPNVEIYEIPFYQGPTQLIKRYWIIQQKIKNVYEGCNVALFRMPSPTAQLIWNKRSRAYTIPLGLEVVYDISDSVNASSMTIIEKSIAKIQMKQLKKACIEANGVSYVTEYTIQNHFPSRAKIKGETEHYFETYYSTITLDESAFGKPRDFADNRVFTLVISDVAMNSYRKGEKVLFAAMQKLLNKGYDIKAIVIGDGSKRSEYEGIVEKMGMRNRVLFTGLLSSASEVRHYLNNSDIFVFPSVAEGLPRGVLEAMAVGLPVVTSPVGGIPEVLSQEYLANPFDIDAYVDIIERLINNPDEMNDASRRNIEVAHKFDNDILQEKRNAFYKKLSNMNGI